jgi:hypothetical protein
MAAALAGIFYSVGGDAFLWWRGKSSADQNVY